MGSYEFAQDVYGQAPPNYGPPQGFAPPGPGQFGGYPPQQMQQFPAPGGSEELRTLFLTGFPTDIKERELNNLLRFFPGYEASQMNTKNGLAQGFALFATGQTALAANSAVNGLQFDGSTQLRSEMARKNMYIKDEGAQKRARTGPGGFSQLQGGSGGPSPAPYFRPAMPRPRLDGGGAMSVDNPPCNTLYVCNLVEGIHEAQLRQVFATQPGFCQLKVMNNGKATSCFVEYETVAAANLVHTGQQGVVIASNDNKPIRIQYSKNPFGRKRDRETGLMIDVGAHSANRDQYAGVLGAATGAGTGAAPAAV
ncbi:MAG: hypothetical protein WDW38_008311 [Sanguina aurantia]